VTSGAHRTIRPQVSDGARLKTKSLHARVACHKPRAYNRLGKPGCSARALGCAAHPPARPELKGELHLVSILSSYPGIGAMALALPLSR